MLPWFRSSNKADGRWAGQPLPAPPVTGFNCFNDLYVHSSTGLCSPEACNNLQSLSVNSRTRMMLSCGEDARSSLEMLDEAVEVRLLWEGGACLFSRVPAKKYWVLDMKIISVVIAV